MNRAAERAAFRMRILAAFATWQGPTRTFVEALRAGSLNEQLGLDVSRVMPQLSAATLWRWRELAAVDPTHMGGHYGENARGTGIINRQAELLALAQALTDRGMGACQVLQELEARFPRGVALPSLRSVQRWQVRRAAAANVTPDPATRSKASGSVFDFDGWRVRVFEYQGRRVWLPSEIASALGYTDPGELRHQIRGRWAEDFIVGHDYLLLEGAEVRDFEKVLGLANSTSQEGGLNPPSDVTNFASPAPGGDQRLLLTEEGVNTVLLLTRKPAGRRLRRYLADEVLPQLRRTGSYLPPWHEAKAILEEQYRCSKLRMQQRTATRLLKAGAIDQEEWARRQEMAAAAMGEGR